MISEVREKWSSHPELSHCHHFLFDYKFRPGEKSVLFMGINPGEVEKDWQDFPEGKCEESRFYDFRAEQVLPTNSIKWHRLIDAMVPKQFGVILSELFFCSSKNITQLDQRIPDWKSGDLVKFCAKANKQLIAEYGIKIVITTSVSYTKNFKDLYSLTLSKKWLSSQNNRRLVEEYLDAEGVVWLFCLHSNTRGLKKSEKDEIAQILSARSLQIYAD